MNPPPAFLTDVWRDVIAVAGLFGVVLTVIGLGIACLQLRKTVGANAAAIDALNESREQYERYLIGQINRLYSESRLFVTTEQWTIAAVRLDDVADLIAHFPDEGWKPLSERLREMSTQFRRIQADEIPWKTIKSKWRKLDVDLVREISRQHAPFKSMREMDDADKGHIS